MKKLILSILIFLTIFVSFAPYSIAKAQTWYNSGFVEWYTKVYDEDMSPPTEIFGERYTAAQVQWVIWGLMSLPLNWVASFNEEGVSCFLKRWGANTIDLGDCAEGYLNNVKKVIDVLIPHIQASSPNTSLFALVFNTDDRPVSGIGYVKNVLAKISTVQEVKAQEGFGYGALGIVLPLWKVVRNIAYTAFVIIAIVFSFMIMFRVKISPQTVISVQSALPKIIMAMILVTFSFAIAGLMVDLIYVIIGLVSIFLNTTGWSIGTKAIYQFISGQPLGITFTSFVTVFYYMYVYTILFLISIIAAFIAAASSWSIIGMLLSILMLLLVVWLMILCIWYMIKIPWMLIKALIGVYFSVIIAPLQIAFGAFAPQMGFGAWLKNLIANLLVFPLTGIFFYLAYLLLGYSLIVAIETAIERDIIFEIFRALGFNIQGFIPGNLWSPPLLGSGAEITPLIFALMSFSIIIAIPKVTDILKSLIMGEKFTFGTAIGEAMAPVKGIWGATGQPYVRGAQEAVGKGFASTLSGSTKTGRLSKLPQWAKDIIQKGAP